MKTDYALGMFLGFFIGICTTLIVVTIEENKLQEIINTIEKGIVNLTDKHLKK